MFGKSTAISWVTPERADFTDSIRKNDLQELARQPALETLQCVKPVMDSTWSLVNEIFFSSRPDVELRVYGHYASECDLSFTPRMTNVRRFSADCLMEARNVGAIAEMPQLETLSIGIFELQDFDVLERVPSTLVELSLGATRSKKPRVDALGRFKSLKTVHLEGQSKGIEVLSELAGLEDLTLRSITTPDLCFLAPLRNLWSLDIKLGGIRSFEGIEGKPCIKYLELWQIRGLERVDVIGSLPGLQNLFLQSLPQVRELPALESCRSLRRAVLMNMKGMADFTVFEAAPVLEEFALIEGHRQQPEQLMPVLRNRALRGAEAFFGSTKRNQAFERLRDSYGKQAWSYSSPFEYR